MGHWLQQCLEELRTQTWKQVVIQRSTSGGSASTPGTKGRRDNVKGAQEMVPPAE